MAITTLAGILAGLTPPIPFAKADPGNIGATASIFVDLWINGGTPGVGAYDATINGATLIGPNVAGQLKYTNPASGNCYLAKLQATWNPPNIVAPNGTTLMLIDRLWHNKVANTGTTAQNITSPTWPARDVAGSANGDGVSIALVESTVGSPSLNTPQISYTNSAGVSGRTATAIQSGGTAITQGWNEFGLQAGDTGVQSIQSFTWVTTAPGAGTWNLVAFRPICKMAIPIGGFPYECDAVQAGMPRIFDNSVLSFVAGPGGSNAMNGIRGHLLLTQG